MKAPTAKQGPQQERKPAPRPKPRAKPPEQAKAGRRPAYLQAKLAMSRPGDASEQEADRVADQVATATKAPSEHSELQREARDETVPAARTIARATAPPEEKQAARRSDEEERQIDRQADGAEEPEALARAGTEDTEEAADTAPEDQLDAATERRIESLRGTGDPLPERVRTDMETRLGADLSEVRIHTGGEAAALCNRLNARAFTVGNDVFFAPGEYAPETEGGRRLLAHELTHVVQQSGGIGRMLQRDGNDGGNNTSADGSASQGPTPHLDDDWVEFPSLPYPQIPKLEDSAVNPANFLPLIRHRAYSSSGRGTSQTQNWFSSIKLGGVEKALRDSMGERGGGDEASTMTVMVPSPYSKVRRGGRLQDNVRYLRGSIQDIARESIRPSWTPSAENAPLEGRQVSYEVDHVVEVQVGAKRPGGDAPEHKEDLDSTKNYVLMRGSKNNRKGSAVYGAVKDALEAFATGNADTYQGRPLSEWDPDALRGQLSLQFNAFDWSEQVGGFSLDADDIWTVEEIESGKHIEALVTEDQIHWVDINTLEQQVDDDELMIFHSESGGLRRIIKADGSDTRFLKPFILHGDSRFGDAVEDPNALAELYFSVEDDNGALLKPLNRTEEPIKVLSMNGSPRVGYYESGRISALAGLRREASAREEQSESRSGQLQSAVGSPIQVERVEPGENGLLISGRILPTVSLLENAYLDFAIDGDEITVSRTFGIDDITVPRPFSVDSCEVTVSGGTNGVSASGEVHYAVEGLGEGSARARYHSENGFSLGGDFNFDERLFGRGANARINFDYSAGEWTIGGQVTIPRGKVPGINSATIEATYSESEGFSASGDAELDIPGVERGTLSISHSEAEGLAIGGSFELSADTPGIRSGSLSAEVRERADGDGYALTASGEAVPDLPGLDSRLQVAYDNGAITAEAEARYQRGMLDGTIRAGATNRALDEEGNPTGEPTDEIIVFGGGEVTIQIAPWLEGTAGIEFAPNGEITVRGEIGLPDQIEIFPRKEIDKRIFGISVQAPIVPGIVAEIGGGLSAEAGIGPGVIDELRLGIEYNPAHEENTHVTGDAHLSVPADAGLRLSVRAGIGLGITGASATGGLEVGGTLGIEGAAEAGVHIDWMPSQGLELNADVNVHAQPSFTFDISGYVSVTVLGGEVYGERWELASFTYGSDYRFGIRLPVTYKEGEPFDVSLDDVEFEVPDIDTNRLLRGLVEEIA